MTGNKSRAVLDLASLVVGATLGLFLVALGLPLFRGHHRPATAAGTSDVPPMGWTVSCHYAALGEVCQTYPPGDRRWEPALPSCVLAHLPSEIPCRP